MEATSDAATPQFVVQGGIQGQTLQLVQAQGGQQLVQLSGAQQHVATLNGQQVVLQTLPQQAPQTIQIQGQNGQLQQIQLVQQPQVQSQQQFQVVQSPQLQAGQLLQTTDGQTVVYQQPEAPAQPAAQPQVLQLQQPQQGGIIQLPAGQTLSLPNASGGQNMVMMVGSNGVLQAVPAASQVPQRQTGSEVLEEEPLYVNAKQYNRILKRRADRAKLESEGKIPKQRAKYLHESRHLHAMKRVRGQGGRFFTSDDNPPKKPKTEKLKDDNITVKQETHVSRPPVAIAPMTDIDRKSVV